MSFKKIGGPKSIEVEPFDELWLESLDSKECGLECLRI